MKIAYLISAYTDPTHLGRLVRALDSENSEFFIHIDLNVDIAPFCETTTGKNVHFVENRVKVRWGAFSQVLAIVEMLDLAFKSNISFGRFVSMTGTDYPLWSNDKIQQVFNDNKKKEYLCGINSTLLTPQIEKKYYMGDLWPLKWTFLAKVIRRIMHIGSKLPLIRRKPRANLNNQDVEVWHGSDYWALTNEAARYVLRVCKNDQKYMQWMQKAFIPSERFVQTIIMNSPYSEYTSRFYDDISFNDISPLHYVIYTDKIHICTMEDYGPIVKNDKMLFRKAITGLSDELMAKIDLVR